MTAHWPALTAALDTCTAVCAGANSLYFVDRFFASEAMPVSRRVAIGALLLTSVAMLLEAAVLILLIGSDRPVPLGSAAWVTIRALPAVASALVTAAVVRKVKG